MSTIMLTLLAEIGQMGDLRVAIETIRGILAAQGWTTESWEVPDGEPRTNQWVDEFIAAGDGTEHDTAVARIVGGGRTELYIGAHDVLTWTVDWDGPVSRGAEVIAQLAEMLCSVVADTAIRSGSLYRSGWSAISCLPDLELVRANEYAVFAQRADFERDLGSVAALREAGFDVVETDDGVLARRALDRPEADRFLDAVREGQWHLARVARPGVVRHRSHGPPPDELRAAWRVGAPRLKQVGYLPQLEALEYAAYLEPGEHIRGWEIDELRWLLEAGKLPDGDPLEAIRVVFPDRAMAEREKRPLLDVGIRVLYMERGREHELTE